MHNIKENPLQFVRTQGQSLKEIIQETYINFFGVMYLKLESCCFMHNAGVSHHYCMLSIPDATATLPRVPWNEVIVLPHQPSSLNRSTDQGAVTWTFPDDRAIHNDAADIASGLSIDA